MSNILVIAPHADDETLGCGGTLLRHRAEGDSINWLLVTGMSRENGYSSDQIEHRLEQLNAVAGRYDFDQRFQLKLKPAALDTLPLGALISPLKEVIAALQPDTLYLPFRGDVHSDHRQVFDAAIAASKCFRSPSVRRIIAYETLSESDFSPPLGSDHFEPNLFVNIDDYIDEKLAIMALYEEELGEPPFPRNLEALQALARYRGAAACCHHAEAFMVLKEIR